MLKKMENIVRREENNLNTDMNRIKLVKGNGKI